MRSKDLEKEGWIKVGFFNRNISQDEIDELVFDTWGWANKLNVKKLKENKYLLKRVKDTNFKEVFDKKQKRIQNSSR